MARYSKVPGQYRTFQSQFDHERHHGFLRARSSARWRNEKWDLSIEDFFKLWSNENEWNNRGRKMSSFVMSRIDQTQSWSSSNTQIVQRIQNQNQTRISKSRPKQVEITTV